MKTSGRNINRWNACLRASMAAFLVAGAAGTASASYYHDLARNQQPCSDCHTLHYSQSGVTPQGAETGGPFPSLLVRSTTNKLCLFCHDGSDPNAPAVLAPVTMYTGSGSEFSGAGYFASSGGAVSGTGHNLGVLSATVPFSSMTNVTLTCSSCHDPHGTTNYRNIVTAPAGGTGVEAQMARDVFRNAPPSDPPSAAGSIAAYARANEGYKSSTSRWCAECHDALKPTANNAQSPGDTARVHHLTDVPLNGTYADGTPYSTDPAHWLTGIGAGFGTTTGDGVEGVPRIRFQVPLATDFVSSHVAAQDNQVQCGSCHLAHGGPYQKGLQWPYIEGGADQNSGCEQCHNF